MHSGNDVGWGESVFIIVPVTETRRSNGWEALLELTPCRSLLACHP